jgi:hypothetical protein
MKEKKPIGRSRIEIVWQAVSSIIRSQKTYEAAVSAVSEICDGDGSLFRERVYAPLLERWGAANPAPAKPVPDATRSIRAEYALATREYEQGRRNFQAAVSYLKLRAGLRIKRTGTRKAGARGKAEAKGKAESGPLLPLDGKITARTITGMLRAVLAASGWTLDQLNDKIAIAMTELQTELQAK